MTANTTSAFVLLGFASSLAIGWFTVVLRQIFESHRDGAYQRMWALLSVMLIPLAIIIVYWVTQGDVSVPERNWLLGALGTIIGAPTFIWLGYILTTPITPQTIIPISSPTSDIVPAVPKATSSVLPQVTPPDPDTERAALLHQRSRLEIQARDASGESLVVGLTQGITIVKLIHDRKEYTLSMHIANPFAIWLNSTNTSMKDLYVIKNYEKGKLIDTRSLRSSRGPDTITIGQRALIELNDGIKVQLILVGVQWYRSGDEKDEARIKYRFYESSEFLINAL